MMTKPELFDSSGAIYADTDALHRRPRINRQPLLLQSYLLTGDLTDPCNGYRRALHSWRIRFEHLHLRVKGT
jgi:hypothetical protein